MSEARQWGQRGPQRRRSFCLYNIRAPRGGRWPCAVSQRPGWPVSARASPSRSWLPRTVTEGPAERLGVWEEHGVQGSRGERVSRLERPARSLVPTGHVRRGLRAELGGGHGGLVTSREPLPWGCGCGNQRGLSTHCQRSWKTARQPRAPLLARGAEQRPWRGQAQSDG